MKLLTADDVHRALVDSEVAVLRAVQSAYIAHDLGQSDLPFSAFVRPIDQPSTRFIALPAYLGGDHPLAGVKWVSSFPHNVDTGRQRASSLVLLSGLDTGYPRAIVEGSRINAWRTAASAALASMTLRAGNPVTVIGVIGCGTIALEQVRFLRVAHPESRTALLFDHDPQRARQFGDVIAREFPQLTPTIVDRAERVVEGADTVAVTTTAPAPWLTLPSSGRPAGQVLLHVSLRDLTTASILAARNVVDDVEHVNRENTSISLAARQQPDLSFVQGTLGSILRAGTYLPDPAGVVFSPFGLGILDLAVAALVLDRSSSLGLGTEVPGFDPPEHVVAGTIIDSTGARS
ncbi:2,3-diaminopropionate biosynthesis protein SbnB [Rhodococcus sp. KRD162]|uniref:2,3-diaminopropionate biosynthesis protein SbnB n=1 Tax=Rhodococcus sp. KRD162 TaxID=2729725 RepID=UPI0019D122D2|nr:2,3-diaminopropionate biosynthesis protein SbnB [Rhodococcus sp. KRD162]